MKILAIETSCDETAIAIAELHSGRGLTRMRSRTHADASTRVRVLSQDIASQVKIHAAYGGVVPNLARREHEKNLVPMLVVALTEAHLKNPKLQNIKPKQGVIADILTRETELLQKFKKSIMPLALPDIDAIAVTYGPGLAPALWTGVNFARALATLWDKPLIPVNHMAGHFFSAFLGKDRAEVPQFSISNFQFPILALLVSGGHTELVLVKKPWRFQIIGCTRDDAVGEAFDKVGRILGLPYPGGPEIARLAEKGNPSAYTLPRPMLHTKDYNFSFSGLKTAVLYLVRDIGKLTPQKKKGVAASFQAAAIEVLVKKTIRAAKEYKVSTLALGGGVAANTALRVALYAAIEKDVPATDFFIPDILLCGDNALMIATAAYFLQKKTPWQKIIAMPNLQLAKQ